MPSGSRRSARRAEALHALQHADEEGPRVPAGERVEDGHVVRSVAGTASARPYRCPGCDQEIRAGVIHVVAWPADDRGDLTDRRHWHTGCWRARDRRAPGIQRARSAPRYG